MGLVVVENNENEAGTGGSCWLSYRIRYKHQHLKCWAQEQRHTHWPVANSEG